MLIETLKRHWWVPVIRGIAAIVFGIIAVVYPGLTIATLVLLFGAWVLIDGTFRIVGRIGHRASDLDGGWQPVMRIIGIIVVRLPCHAPEITAVARSIHQQARALEIGAA